MALRYESYDMTHIIWLNIHNFNLTIDKCGGYFRFFWVFYILIYDCIKKNPHSNWPSKTLMNSPFVPSGQGSPRRSMVHGYICLIANSFLVVTLSIWLQNHSSTSLVQAGNRTLDLLSLADGPFLAIGIRVPNCQEENNWTRYKLQSLRWAKKFNIGSLTPVQKIDEFRAAECSWYTQLDMLSVGFPTGPRKLDRSKLTGRSKKSKLGGLIIWEWSIICMETLAIGAIQCRIPFLFGSMTNIKYPAAWIAWFAKTVYMHSWNNVIADSLIPSTITP